MKYSEKSRVTFRFQEGLKVRDKAQYSSLGIIPILEDDHWKGVAVEIIHDSDASSPEIIEKARTKLHNLLVLIGVGIGGDLSIDSIQIRFIAPTPSAKTIVTKSIQMDAIIERPLKSMPGEELVKRLNEDPRLKRQCEALNAAMSNSDVISRIRWTYLVLEQEKNRKQGYKVPPDFRHIRNAVSHPELDDSKAKKYFQSELGVDFPDLSNPGHLKFLKRKSREMLREAAQLVEEKFEDGKFWQ